MLSCCPQLRNTYGNVYSVFLGTKAAVVINGMKAMKDAIVTKGIDFAGRPQDLFVNDTTERKGKTDMMSHRADIVSLNVLFKKKRLQ